MKGQGDQMKRGAMLDRGIAAVSTIAFMTFVRPDAEPSRVEVTILAILMYEAIRFCSWYIRRVNRRKKTDQYITTSRQDMKRWAAERLDWPMYEEVI